MSHATTASKVDPPQDLYVELLPAHHNGRGTLK